MTFDEVFPAFKAGKKIKVGKWPEGSYFYHDTKDYVHCIPGLNDEEQRRKFIGSLLRKDWEVVEDGNERGEPAKSTEPEPALVKTLRRRLRD